MKTFEIRPIKTETEYKAALQELEKIWSAKRDTPEGDIFELLALVIDDYESKQFPMPALDPIEAIKYQMEERGLHQKDLLPYFGSKSRVSEILNRKKPLTLKMIKTLFKDFGIPAETLLS
ncbi:type II toxin-antitoxin system HigA family antitoxin [Dyadobacter sp. NIV53]|uniref:helix-turn-helix domain-containing protein n=1 Tax=Dyadobacter sp. NIV53 TaxID=2861765 RepID=UPI001C86CD90|nr:transcriptional regulator [Dyadobacter sp. NIV53]